MIAPQITIDIAKAVLNIAFTPNCSATKRQPARAVLVPSREQGFAAVVRQRKGRSLNSVAERDKSIAVRPASHACRRRIGKMAEAHDRGLITKTVEDLAPGCSGLDGVVIGHHAQLR